MTVLTLPGAMTAAQVRIFKATCAAITAAIESARDAGVPQALIVALLHGHAHRETAAMIEECA